MSDPPDLQPPPEEDPDFWGVDASKTRPLPLFSDPTTEIEPRAPEPEQRDEIPDEPESDARDVPIEELVFQPRATEPAPEPVRIEPPVVSPREASPWRAPQPSRSLAFKKRRYATLATFAQALIPPGGVITESASDVGVADRMDAAAASFDPAVRKRISRLLQFWEWQSVFTRALRPFSRLPMPVAVGVVDRASRSHFPFRKQAFQLLKVLTLNEWASTPQVERQVGFTYSCETHSDVQETTPLEVLGYPQITADHVEECDAVVIGSGAGGAVVAKELAEVGLSVIVLEEGALFTRKDFAGPPWDRTRKMYRANGTTMALGRPSIPLPMGRAVGGTTLVNSGTCFRTPDRILERWGAEWGIEGIDPESMRPYFDRVERILHVKTIPEDVLGRNAYVFHRGVQAMGLHGAPIQRNIEGCRGCGVCTFGCPTDAKQSTHISYLPRAQKHGASIYARCRADRIIVEGGRARGVEASLLDEHGEPKARLVVRSNAVVVSAGAVHTPSLLAGNALAGRSGMLGRNLRIHPAAAVAAQFDEDVYSWRGTLQSYYVDDWHESHDLMIEVTSITPGVAAGSFPGTGQEAKDMIAHARQLAMAGVFVSDSSSGRVRRTRGEPLVTYALNTTDTRKLVRGITHIAEIFFAAGARRVFTGVPRVQVAESKADLENIKEEGIRPGALRLTAFHPAGTARMGADPATSVVDPWGQSHEVGGLFVADAAMLPGCPGVNPMVTIMAMATRTADHLVRTGARLFS